MFHTTLGWLHALDLRLSLLFNGANAPVVAFFALMGRLGDGPLWLAAMVPALLLAGPGAPLRIAASLLTGGVIYRLAKQHTARPRPHVTCPDIRLLAVPLDRYSFPSGHTLHAFSSAVVIGDALPHARYVLWPLAALIGVSRVVLGLHYPSDVAAGAAVGLAVGLAWTAP